MYGYLGCQVWVARIKRTISQTPLQKWFETEISSVFVEITKTEKRTKCAQQNQGKTVVPLFLQLPLIILLTLSLFNPNSSSPLYHVLLGTWTFRETPKKKLCKRWGHSVNCIGEQNKRDRFFLNIYLLRTKNLIISPVKKYPTNNGSIGSRNPNYFHIYRSTVVRRSVWWSWNLNTGSSNPTTPIHSRFRSISMATTIF